MILKSEFLSKLIIPILEQNDVELQYSKYQPGGKSQTLYRETFQYQIKRGQNFNGIQNNGDKYEIALHSTIKIADQQLHIPMVDFNVNSNLGNVAKVFKKLKVMDSELYIYNSGRSFHGYYLNLLNSDDWYKYLGSLLLLNDRKKPFKYIDTRWVGHCLEHGYSALRLSKNSNSYLSKPIFVTII